MTAVRSLVSDTVIDDGALVVRVPSRKSKNSLILTRSGTLEVTTPLGESQLFMDTFVLSR